MVGLGQGNESRSKLSWADEVEREEQEEASQSQYLRRPNPFGSARPREVVLQERGIDWRILDQDHVKNRFHEKPPVLVAHRNQIPLTFVPPVRYSIHSKNAVANWVAKPHTLRKRCFDSEKENMFHNHKHKKSYPRRDKNPDLCQNQQNAGSCRKGTEPINRKISVFSPLINEEIEKELQDLEQQDKEVQLVGDTDVKSEKPGQCGAKTKRSRRKNSASNESGTGFQELCNGTLPSCVPQVAKTKKTGSRQKHWKRRESKNRSSKSELINLSL